MNCLFKNATVYKNGKFIKSDIFVCGDTVFSVGFCIGDNVSFDKVIDCNKYFIFPGLIDVHVHLRQPGFFYKETVKTGTAAAARGGYTTVCSMPNLNPVPDCKKNLAVQTDIIKTDALIGVYPYGAITKGEMGEELSDICGICGGVCAFSDDGRGVQNEKIMESAMLQCKKYNKILAAHCEDNSLLNGGYIHDGEYARKNSHRGISSQSEWQQIERDVQLAEKTGCKYHVCHVSTKQSVEIIRRAKARGVDVTCETAPHYLLLCDEDMREDGRFKMNPPLRSRADRDALISGIKDGTVDMIATDHAPHSAEEKSRGLEKSLMGISGLETAFPALYTGLVKTGVISLEKLIYLMHDAPSRRFGIGGSISPGESADFTLFDLSDCYSINSKTFLSMGKSTPFDGEKVFGKCKMTLYKGEIVWQDNSTEK